MKNLILAATALAASLTMSAQTTSQFSKNILSNPVPMNDWNTFKVSYSPTTLDFDGIEDWDLEGFTIEYLRGTNIIEGLPVFFEWGAGFELMTMTDKEKSTENGYNYTIESKISIADLYMPFNLGYKIALKENIVIMPYVGIKAQLNVLGRQISTYDIEGYISGKEDEVEFNMFDDEEWGDVTLKRTWLGWHIGATVELKRLNFGIRYGSSFTEEFFKDIDDCELNTTSISIGFIF